MRLVAPLEVAQPPRGPDLPEIPLGHQLLDHLVLLWGLDGDEVHAALAAKITGVKPRDLVALEIR